MQTLLTAYKELENRIKPVEEKLPAYEMVKKVAESALKKLKEEGLIKALGVGRSRKYVYQKAKT